MDLDQRFAVFEQEMRSQFYRRAYGYYTVLAILAVGGSVLCLYIMTLSPNPWVQALNAILLAFWGTQAGLLAHDLSHGQVFVSPQYNRFFSKVVWGLFGGLSESGWYGHHSTHHTHVNQAQRDPDVSIMPVIYSAVQLPYRSAFVKKYILPYQHILFFLVTPVAYPGIVFETGVRYPTKRAFFEYVLIAIHFIVLFYFIVSYLPFYSAAVFLVVYTGAVGIYISSVFAPNHKGKEIFDQNEKVGWRNQITSTRNLVPSWFTFHFFGGLNFQIEHHLFSDVPRIRYPYMQPYVKKFCLENGIPYDEQTWFGSMKAIYRSLEKASRLASVTQTMVISKPFGQRS